MYKRQVQDALWAALLCALCFAGFFSSERQSGMIKVIGTTPLGRVYTVRMKLCVAAALCSVLTVLSLLPRFWVVLRDYGLGAWMAPVYSMAEYFQGPELPLFLVAALLILSRFLAIGAMACVTMMLSQRLGNTFGALFASLLLFALPPLLSLSGLTNAKWCSVYLPFHLCALLGDGGGVFLAVFFPLLFCGLCYYGKLYLEEHFGEQQ